MKIREASRKDIPQLKKLFLESQKYEINFDEDLTINEQTKITINRLINEIFKDPNRKIFVAEDGNFLRGYIWLNFAPGVTKGGWIVEIFVAQDSRRKGIGSKLLNTAYLWMKQRKAKSVKLTAYKTNKGALLFYQKHQFKKEPRKLINLVKEIK